MVLLNPADRFVDVGDSMTFFVWSLIKSYTFQTFVDILDLLAFRARCFQRGFPLFYLPNSCVSSD